MSTTRERPLLGFYGDDFTGSTDVLEALSVSGVPAVLFLTPQDATRHAGEFGAARALGIAGISRSLPTARMDEELDPAFTALGRLRPQHVLYKLCSTFDSSPELGSNGHALETLLRHFPASWIPLVVGAPALRRYMVFGNLFAGFRTTTTRLDRHPTMSRHPVTPMGEADLRLHLARQTTLPLGLVDCLALSAGTAVARRALDDIRAATPGGIVFFDTLTNEHLDVIGELLSSAEGADRDTPIAPIAGSSAIVYALARAWARAGLIEVARALPAPTPIERLLVVSGSAAPQTAAQLAAAEAAGWAMFRIDVPALAGTQGAAEFARLVDAAAGALAAGRSTVLFSARGPDDPALTAGIGASATLGAAQGRLVREILLRSGIRRACVAGGDTSGHAARQLGIYALEFVGSVAPGAPLCRARSSDPAFNGVELALKGGQCGDDRYFLKLGR